MAKSIMWIWYISTLNYMLTVHWDRKQLRRPTVCHHVVSGSRRLPSWLWQYNQGAVREWSIFTSGLCAWHSWAYMSGLYLIWTELYRNTMDLTTAVQTILKSGWRICACEVAAWCSSPKKGQLWRTSSGPWSSTENRPSSVWRLG